MPSNVLEKPAIVENVPRQESKIGSNPIDPREAQLHVAQKSGNPPNLRQHVGLVLREIFEGHREYLGYTPD